MKRQSASSCELLQHENLICSHGHRNLEHDTSTLVIRSMKELFEVSKYHKSHGLQFYSIVLLEIKKDANNHVKGRLKRDLKNTIETYAHWL
jgi:hypothetical protein